MTTINNRIIKFSDFRLDNSKYNYYTCAYFSICNYFLIRMECQVIFEKIIQFN